MLSQMIALFQLKYIKTLHNQVIIKNKEITLIDLNNYKLWNVSEYL